MSGASPERRPLLAHSEPANEPMISISGATPDKGLPASTISIIIVEFCERFAFYGSSLCFTMYLLDMLRFSNQAMVAIISGFTAWCYASALIGGYMGDVVIGKVKTILVFAVIYFIGLICLTMSALPWTYADYPNDPQTIAYVGFFIALFLIGLGTGGIKSNVSVLVADQIDDPERVEKAFRYFYWSINAGALLGQLLVPMLHHFGPLPRGINASEGLGGSSFWMSFSAPSLMFIVGIIVFVAGMPAYKKHDPTANSIITRSIAIIKKAYQNRKTATEETRASTAFLDMALLAAPANVYSDSLAVVPPSEKEVQLVSELKAALHATKIFIAFPVYWVMYNQMQTTFISQGMMLRTPTWMSVDQLNIVDPICIILLIPIFDSFVFPGLRRIGVRLSMIGRISIGFIFAASALLYAGWVQHMVIQEGYFNQQGVFVPTIPHDMRTSVFIQAPAFILIAISEIFSSVTALELAYSQAPKTMKSMVMSLFLLTSAVGSLLGVFIAPVMTSANLMPCFFALGGTMIAFAIGFYFIYRSHRMIEL